MAADLSQIRLTTMDGASHQLFQSIANDVSLAKTMRQELTHDDPVEGFPTHQALVEAMKGLSAASRQADSALHRTQSMFPGFSVTETLDHAKRFATALNESRQRKRTEIAIYERLCQQRVPRWPGPAAAGPQKGRCEVGPLA